jgi:hypothetical protein
MIDIRNILVALVNYYDFTRQVGHTTTLLKGANNTDCLTIFPTLKMAKYCNRREKDSISLHNISKLRGLKKPIAIDNAALYTILKEALNEIDRLNEANKRILI